MRFFIVNIGQAKGPINIPANAQRLRPKPDTTACT